MKTTMVISATAVVVLSGSASAGDRVAVRTVALSDAQAVGLAPGTVYSSIGELFAVNNDGDVTFFADGGVYSSSGGIEVIAKEGEQIPGIVGAPVFGGVLEESVSINDHGVIAIVGGTQTFGGLVFIGEDTFDVVPGLNDGSTFRSSFDERIGFNNAGSVLFRAGVSDSRVGIFGTTPSGELVYVAVTGELFNVSNHPMAFDYRLIESISNDFVLNDNGEILFKLSFTDGTEGLFYASLLDTQTACPADLDSSGNVNFGDVAAFLMLYSAGDLSVDFDGSGTLSFGDVTVFLQLYWLGCP